jgi:TspO/MBR family
VRRYNRLKKPEWTPPKWVFGPTWAVMYAAQGYAGWRVLHQASSRSKLFCADRHNLSLTAESGATGHCMPGPAGTIVMHCGGTPAALRNRRRDIQLQC